MEKFYENKGYFIYSYHRNYVGLTLNKKAKVVISKINLN